MDQRTTPTPPSTTIAEFDTYEEAQRLVDKLSDARFPVQHVRIVGTGITTVEQVVGRMTVGKAALMGALGGAWLGLFVGILFVLFFFSDWLLVLWAALLGVVWGAIFGAVGHALTRGQRDFTSVQGIRAARYQVQVDEAQAAEAVRVMGGGAAEQS